MPTPPMTSNYTNSPWNRPMPSSVIRARQAMVEASQRPEIQAEEVYSSNTSYMFQTMARDIGIISSPPPASWTEPTTPDQLHSTSQAYYNLGEVVFETASTTIKRPKYTSTMTHNKQDRSVVAIMKYGDAIIFEEKFSDEISASRGLDAFRNQLTEW